MANIIQNTFFGYNNRLSPYLVPNDTPVDLLNFTLDDLGNPEKRNGYTAFNAVQIDANPITGLWRHYEGTGTGANKVMLARSSTNIYAGTDGTGAWTPLTVAGDALLDARTQFVTFENTTIFTNSTNLPKKYTVAGGVADLGGSPPDANYIATNYGRVWLAGDPANPSRVTFSEVSAPEIWTAWYYIEVSENDGDQITGIKSSSIGLIVWKKHSIHVITGNSLASFSIMRISSHIGCVAPYSIAEVNGRFYFLAMDGVYSTAGDSPVLESYPIQTTIDDIRRAGITTSFGFAHNNKYCLSYQSSATTDTTNKRMIVMDTTLRDLNSMSVNKSAWTRYDGHRVNCACNWNAGNDVGETYFGDSAAGHVFRFDNGSTDNGSAFQPYLKTKFYGDEVEKMYDLLYVEAQAPSGGELIVTYRTSKPSNGGTITLDLTSTDDVYDTGVYGTARYGNEDTKEYKGPFYGTAAGRFVQLEIRGKLDSYELALRGINIVYEQQPAYV